MGNTAQQKPSPMVKNWVRLDSGSYRNAITEELIDEHRLEYSSEEQLQAGQAQLAGRANLTHPNVVKLIYFCQEPRGECCGERRWAHRVFIEHQHQQLAAFLAQPPAASLPRPAEDCFCCPIANAFAYLSQKFGYFRVTDSMIFLVSQIKWHKNHDKKTVKVWISSNLPDCRPQQPCRQDEMVASIVEIFRRIGAKGLCGKLRSLQGGSSKLEQLFEEVYQVHNHSYQRVDERKRVLSTYNSSNPNFHNSNPAHHSSQDTLLPIHTHRLTPNLTEPDSTARNFNKTTELIIKKEEVETTKKIIPSPATKRVVAGGSVSKEPPASPFYRPPHVSKISFAYNDLFSTPKQVKAPLTTLNTSSPLLTHQPLPKPQPAPLIVSIPDPLPQPKEESKGSSKPNETAKAPKLERMTVNVMVEAQSPKEKEVEIEREEVIVYPQPSEQSLTNRLAEILESEEQITSSPFLLETKEHRPAEQVIEQRCAESINESDYCEQHELPSEEEQQHQVLHYEYENEAPEINIEESAPFAEPHIPLSQSIRESEHSDQQQQDTRNSFREPPPQYFTTFEKETTHEAQEYPVPNFGSSIKQPPLLMHTSNDRSSKKSLDYSHPYEEPAPSGPRSDHSRLDSNYTKYLKKFNQAMNPISPRSKFSSRQQPFESMPNHSTAVLNIPAPFQHKKSYAKYNSLDLDEGSMRQKSKSRVDMEMSDGRMPSKAVHSGELESLYNESVNSQEEKKARIIERIENTEKIIRENRKKLEKIELEKDLEREKEIIKKEMQSLLKNNLMSDESNRIKEKVKYKKATFAELKAEASKILEDLNF